MHRLSRYFKVERIFHQPFQLALSINGRADDFAAVNIQRVGVNYISRISLMTSGDVFTVTCELLSLPTD